MTYEYRVFVDFISSVNSFLWCLQSKYSWRNSPYKTERMLYRNIIKEVFWINNTLSERRLKSEYCWGILQKRYNVEPQHFQIIATDENLWWKSIFILFVKQWSPYSLHVNSNHETVLFSTENVLSLLYLKRL